MRHRVPLFPSSLHFKKRTSRFVVEQILHDLEIVIRLFKPVPGNVILFHNFNLQDSIILINPLLEKLTKNQQSVRCWGFDGEYDIIVFLATNHVKCHSGFDPASGIFLDSPVKPGNDNFKMYCCRSHNHTRIIIDGRQVMKASIKASLLSALIFPGVGQMHLKRYFRGLIPMVLVLTGLVVLIVQATARALQVLDKMQLQGGTVDMNAVSNLAAGASTQGDPYSLFISLGIAVCWIYSVIDAYRLGKEKDRRDVQDLAKGDWRAGNGIP